MPLFFDWISTYGAVVLALLLMVGVFGLPVPDETLLTFAGVLVRQGKLHFATTWTAAAFGSMCGITINAEHLRRVEAWLERWGKWTLTFGYFVPGVRHLTAILAGSAQLPPRMFATYAYAGAALWSLTFITFGWAVGRRWEAALQVMHRHILTVTLVLAAIAAGYLVLHRTQRKPS